jgi:long-chain fatty acid transport protein
VKTVLALLLVLSAFTSKTFAINGAELIGSGPISGSLGGTGVAYPQDPITAIALNPAGLSFLGDGNGLPASRTGQSLIPDKEGKAAPPQSLLRLDHGLEVDLAVTLVFPTISGEINGVKANNQASVFLIPEFAITVPLTYDRAWRFGLEVYGSAGFGVDYRGTALDNSRFYNFGPGHVFPLASGIYTYYSNLRFAPSLSYRISSQWSVGLGIHVDYATLDLGSGSTNGFSAGVQPGIIFRPRENLSIGLTYTSPQPVTFQRVSDFTGNGTLDNLTVATPQEVVLGASWELCSHRILLETDWKWIDWGNADGYKDFGWKDQWVVGVGAQYSIIPKRLFLRVGYNYGNNPIKTDSHWNPSGTTMVQGNAIPNYYYESSRILGVPAISENHIAVGIGYGFNDRFSINLGYTHAFSKSISETGPNLVGKTTTIRSRLSEEIAQIGLTWRY